MLGLTSWKMAKCRRQPSRHPTTVPQCASELPSHQAPPQWHCRHHCRHPTFSSQQSNQQTSLHSISPGHCSRNHSRVMLCCQPCFWAWWGQVDGEGSAVPWADTGSAGGWSPTAQPRWGKEGLRNGEAAASESIQQLLVKKETWRCHSGFKELLGIFDSKIVKTGFPSTIYIHHVQKTQYSLWNWAPGWTCRMWPWVVYGHQW